MIFSKPSSWAMKLAVNISAGVYARQKGHSLFDILKVFFLGGSFAPTPKTRNIVILGSKGAGKTTLWHRLQGVEDLNDSPKNTSQEKIKSFKIDVSDRSVLVSDTVDYGGDDKWATSYENIICNDGTFVYFLVDLLELHEHEEEMYKQIRGRLALVSNICRQKKLKDCGCKILATNKRKYVEQGLEAEHGEPVEYVKKVLKLHTLKRMSIKIDDFILPVELTDEADINKIKEEIINNS